MLEAMTSYPQESEPEHLDAEEAYWQNQGIIFPPVLSPVQGVPGLPPEPGITAEFTAHAYRAGERAPVAKVHAESRNEVRRKRLDAVNAKYHGSIDPDEASPTDT